MNQPAGAVRDMRPAQEPARRPSYNQRVLRTAAGCVLIFLAASPACPESRAILMDGSFADWRGLDPIVEDASGDGAAGGIDLGRLWLADDGEALYLRLEMGRETILQNPSGEAAGSELRLYLDLDASADSGLPAEGLGVELEVRFGGRHVVVYDTAGAGRQVRGGAAGVIGLPTHSAGVFEIRVPLPEGSSTGDLLLVLREVVTGGDRLPDSGAVTYRVSDDALGRPKTIGLDRRKRTDFRLLSLNVEDSLIVTRQKLYRRLLAAVAPDLIAFQSLRDWGAEETRAFVEAVLPLSDGRRWEALQVADAVTLSSFPIVAAAPVDGNLAVRIDLPDEAGDRDLVLFNVHLPCCADDPGRDRESDHLAAFWRDLLAGVGEFAIGPGDAVIYAGDFNFVGYRRQLRAIRDGMFVDPANGPDFAPGRARGSLDTARLRHLAARTTITWRRPEAAFAPGRLDWVFFSGDALVNRKSLVLDTTELTRQERRRYSLRRRDTDRSSDHLPLVADFRLR